MGSHIVARPCAAKKARAIGVGTFESGELSKMRATMRGFWCKDAAHARELPCEVNTFLASAPRLAQHHATELC